MIKKSIHQRRFDFENVQIRDSETFRAFGTRVNRLCNEAHWENFTKEASMCLHFIWGLKDPKYLNIKHKLLLKVEQDCSLEELIEECERIKLLHTEQMMISDRETLVSRVNHYSERSPKKSPSKEIRGSPVKKNVCFRCGKLGHFAANCRAEDKSPKKVFSRKRSPVCHMEDTKYGKSRHFPASEQL